MSKRTLLDARPYYAKEKSLSIRKHKGGLRVADKPKNRKVMIGTVSSSKMDKTITVSIETVKQHPLYKKTIKTSKKYKAHDENNEASAGDIVKIIETKPISKDKRWQLVEIIQKAKTLQ
jgi:small subunit ribosomal protein S17